MIKIHVPQPRFGTLTQILSSSSVFLLPVLHSRRPPSLPLQLPPQCHQRKQQLQPHDNGDEIWKSRITIPSSDLEIVRFAGQISTRNHLSHQPRRYSAHYLFTTPQLPSTTVPATSSSTQSGPHHDPLSQWVRAHDNHHALSLAKSAPPRAEDGWWCWGNSLMMNSCGGVRSTFDSAIAYFKKFVGITSFIHKVIL
ncbi:hypothetical protein HKD37_15G041421 [Glycine soja]